MLLTPSWCPWLQADALDSKLMCPWLLSKLRPLILCERLKVLKTILVSSISVQKFKKMLVVLVGLSIHRFSWTIVVDPKLFLLDPDPTLQLKLRIRIWICLCRWRRCVVPVGPRGWPWTPSWCPPPSQRTSRSPRRQSSLPPALKVRVPKHLGGASQPCQPF